MITGIILAGGQSSRMGQNKALLPYKNARLIDHIAAQLQEAEIHEIYVSGDIEGYSCIADRLQHIGPVGGIEATLHHFGPSQNSYLFTPVDMPRLSAKIYQQLLEAHKTGESCYFADCFLPMLIQDSPVLRFFLQKELAGSIVDCSMKKLLQAINARVIPSDKIDPTCLLNVNTPGEWHNFQTELKANDA